MDGIKRTIHVVIATAPLVDVFLHAYKFPEEEIRVVEFSRVKIVSSENNLISNRYTNFFSMICSLRKSIKFIKSLLTKDVNLEFYIVHALDPLTNFVCQLKGCSINIIPDGALVLTRQTQNFKLQEVLKRKVSSWLCLYDYKYKIGDFFLTQIFSYEKMYLFDQINFWKPDSVKSIVFVDIKTITQRVKPEQRTVMFIGQYVPREHQGYYDKLVNKIIYKHKSNCNRIYYRPHPAEKLSLSQEKQFKELGVQIDSGTRCVEFNDLNCGVFLSIFSSGIFNLALFDQYTCIAYPCNLWSINTSEFEEFKLKMTGLGVEVNELDDV